MMSPSEKAIEAAAHELGWQPTDGPDAWDYRSAKHAVNAAYPLIRADVIAEVVEALRGLEKGIRGAYSAAGFVEREFGEQD